MDGFEKIELQAPSTKTNPPFRQNQPTRPETKSGFSGFGRFKNRKVGAGLLVIFILLVVLIIIPSFLVFASAKKTYAQVNTTIDALKKQDIELAGKELKKTRESLEDTQSKMKYLFILRFIPGPNIYYNDANHL